MCGFMSATEICKAMSEKELQRNVIDLAKAFDWRVFWTWNSIHSPQGWPDLVMLRKGRLVFAELKSEKGKLTPAQEETLEALKLTGHGVYCWKPIDWVSGRIDEILR